MNKTFGVLLMISSAATFAWAARYWLGEQRQWLRLAERPLQGPRSSRPEQVVLSTLFFALTVAEIWFALILLR